MATSPRKDVVHARRLASLISGSSGTSRVAVSVENRRNGFRERMAVIRVGHSDHFDPMEGLRRANLEGVERELAAQPVRHVDPQTITTSDRPRTHSKVHYRSAMKRVPRGFRRMWACEGPRRGWFFMYDDKVLHVGWT